MSIQLSAADLAILEFTNTKMLDSNQASDAEFTSLDSLLAAATAMDVQKHSNDEQNSSSSKEQASEITSSDGIASISSNSNPSVPNENIMSNEAMTENNLQKTPPTDDENENDRDPIDDEDIYPPSLFENTVIPSFPRLKKGELKAGMIRVCGHGNDGKDVTVPWKAAWAVKNKVSVIITYIMYIL